MHDYSHVKLFEVSDNSDWLRAYDAVSNSGMLSRTFLEDRMASVHELQGISKTRANY